MSVDIKNVGEIEGICRVGVLVDGELVLIKDVTVAPGVTEKVSFTIRAKTAGTHTLELDAMAATFKSAWSRRSDSTVPVHAESVAVDTDENVYVVGFAGLLRSSGPGQAFFHKYDAQGTEVWSRELGRHQPPGVESVAVDGAGNAYVTAATQCNALLQKYGPDGTEVWTREFGSFLPDPDHCSLPTNAGGVAVDPLGNIYVVGWTRGALSIQPTDARKRVRDWGIQGTAFLRKYDDLGQEVWTRQFGVSQLGGPHEDEAKDVAVDDSGNVYIVGVLGLPSGDGGDAFVHKYDASGNRIWAREFGTSTSDIGSGVAVARDGSVYVSGVFNLTTLAEGPRDFLRKHDREGNEVWIREWSHGGTLLVGPSVAVDAEANVYVSGEPGLRKFDDLGEEIWNRQFGSNRNGWDHDVAAGRDGNVYVAGPATERAFVLQFVQPATARAPTIKSKPPVSPTPTPLVVPSSTPVAAATPNSTRALAATPIPSKKAAGERSAELVVQGEGIFTGRAGCSACHTIALVSAGLVGPDLTHIGTDATSRKPDLSAREYITESIRDPQAFVATGVQRAIPGIMTRAITAGLSESEVEALVEFLLAQK